MSGHDEEKQHQNDNAGLNRRKFIGALGGAAAAGALLDNIGGGAKAQNQQTVWYQDSFGDVVPAGVGTLSLGIQPPPLPPNVQPPSQQSERRPRQRIRTDSVDAGPTDRHERIRPRDQPFGCLGNYTYYAPTFPQYNILLIMVDQMRNPYFWPPASGSVFNSIPNITKLMNTSYTFPNFFAAATVCSPSRACFLTGLYSQQHCVFKALSPATMTGTMTPPPLIPYNSSWNPMSSPANPGFSTIGNVLSQQLPGYGCNPPNYSYDCTWLGKWHLSCGTALGKSTDGPGFNGPSDYGFTDNFSMPTTNAHQSLTLYPASSYPSPDGLNNEGTGGDFLDSKSVQVSGLRDNAEFCNESSSPFSQGLPPIVQLNDAAVAYAFTNYWLPYAKNNFNAGGGPGTGQPLAKPWFCAVSFVNPHDITEFPYSYGLTSGLTNCPIPTYPNQGWHEQYCVPANASANGFLVPPTTGLQNPTPYYGSGCLATNGTDQTCMSNPTGDTACANLGDVTSIPNLPATYSGVPNNWNFENLSQMSYSNSPTSKPGLQLYFQKQRANIGGAIASPNVNPAGWQTFLNYYLWMQYCVDYQIGQVLGTNPGYTGGLANSPFASNTLVIFTSDHGDYAGSHGLHAKGGALYEEVINVPLYVSLPQQRSNGQSTPIFLPYVCSAVDILPFIYSMALGNESWRANQYDLVYYLNNRESIADAIMQWNGMYTCNTQLIRQRRISTIPLANPVSGGTQPWQLYQPYVLHTADDYSAAYLPDNVTPQPSHAIAFRTADPTGFTAPSTGCPTTQPVPVNGATLYRGGKLGVYSYWNTCNPMPNPPPPNAPIKPITLTNGNAAPDSQYELYDYNSSTPNVAETGNNYFVTGGGVSQQGMNYSSAFTQNSVQAELYQLNPFGIFTGGLPTQQVQAAIQAAYNNYILWLTCMGYITDNTGLFIAPTATTCPNVPGSGSQCPSCASSPGCSANNYIGGPTG